MIEDVVMVRGTGCPSVSSPGLPWSATFTLSPPDFMRVAFVCMHGGMEEYAFEMPSLDHVARLIKQERPNIGDHPRLRRVTVRGPAGIREFGDYPTDEQILDVGGGS